MKNPTATPSMLHSPANGLCRRRILHFFLALLLLLTTAACRRDLWVYTDDLHQVELVTDWSEATEQPGGMTWWFMNDDNSGRNHHGTTAEVTHAWLGLPKGWYSGVVFDYSPAEYAHLSFVGMTHIDSALVHLNPSADQPQPDINLYGDSAVAPTMAGIPRYAATGMYSIAAEPETMNADTLHRVHIITGADGERIPWDEREDYESQVVVQTLNANPKPLVWKLKVQVYVHGINYMNSVRATVAGLTDGCWLGPLRNTSTPCLQALDNWKRTYTSASDNIGYIATEVNTFGLTDQDMPRSPFDARGTRAESSPAPVPYAALSAQLLRESSPAHLDALLKALRLNLQFLLRDNATVLNYHYDLDDECITIDDDRLIITIDIPIDYPGGPDLPYVDEEGTSGFNATVTPWTDGGIADTTM